MKILYQSEVTGKTYQTKQALVEAEKAITEAKKQEELKKQERAAAAKEVQALLDASTEASKKAHDALAKFCEKYGSFKTTIKNDGTDLNWVDWVFNPFKALESFL